MITSPADPHRPETTSPIFSTGFINRPIFEGNASPFSTQNCSSPYSSSPSDECDSATLEPHISSKGSEYLSRLSQQIRRIEESTPVNFYAIVQLHQQLNYTRSLSPVTRRQAVQIITKLQKKHFPDKCRRDSSSTSTSTEGLPSPSSYRQPIVPHIEGMPFRGNNRPTATLFPAATLEQVNDRTPPFEERTHAPLLIGEEENPIPAARTTIHSPILQAES